MNGPKRIEQRAGSESSSLVFALFFFGSCEFQSSWQLPSKNRLSSHFCQKPGQFFQEKAQHFYGHLVELHVFIKNEMSVVTQDMVFSFEGFVVLEQCVEQRRRIGQVISPMISGVRNVMTASCVTDRLSLKRECNVGVISTPDFFSNTSTISLNSSKDLNLKYRYGSFLSSANLNNKCFC